MSEELNPDLVRCPFCEKKYGFTNPRVSHFNKDGTRWERCLACGSEAEKQQTQNESCA